MWGLSEKLAKQNILVNIIQLAIACYKGIPEAVCPYRKEEKIDGPLYAALGTLLLPAPVFGTTIEVLAANQVEVIIASGNEYTPAPVIFHSILQYKTGLADDILITFSHNPADDGVFKDNATNGGPGTDIPYRRKN